MEEAVEEGVCVALEEGMGLGVIVAVCKLEGDGETHASAMLEDTRAGAVSQLSHSAPQHRRQPVDEMPQMRV